MARPPEGRVACTLEPSNSSSADAEVGWWSMCYVQGFEVRLGARAFFAFSSVRPSATAAGFVSQCSAPAVGWYRERAGGGGAVGG